MKSRRQKWREIWHVVRVLSQMRPVGAIRKRYYGPRMKYPSPPNLPEGGTPAERLDMAFRKVLTVPKSTLLKEEAKEKRQREKRRAKKG